MFILHFIILELDLPCGTTQKNNIILSHANALHMMNPVATSILNLSTQVYILYYDQPTFCSVFSRPHFIKVIFF